MALSSDQSRTTFNKEPPNSQEAEKLVLGAMLNNINYLNQAAAELQEDDFYFLENRIIFRILQEAFKQDEPMDLHLTAEELRRQNKLDTIGGSAYLTSLADSAGMTIHIQAYIDIVRSKSVLRKMLQSAKDIFKTVADEPRDVAEALDSAQNSLFRISQTTTVTPYVLVADKLKGSPTTPSFLKNLEETQESFRRHSTNELPIAGLRTHFPDLDQMVNGFSPSNLMILAARPAMGKTALALNIVENMCFRENVPIGIFSLEMTVDQLISRIVCSRSGVESKKINLGDISGLEFQKVVSVVNEMQNHTLLIDDQPGLKITDLRSRARRMKECYDIQFLIIDYLQLLSGSGNRQMENRQVEITEISRMLKTLARELHIPILCLSQLSRKVEDRANHRPMMSDLRESGSIEQDSDLVMFLLRREYYDPHDKPGLAELIVAKNRHGSIGSIQLVFEKSFARFQSFASPDPLDDF